MGGQVTWLRRRTGGGRDRTTILTFHYGTPVWFHKTAFSHKFIYTTLLMLHNIIRNDLAA